MTVDEIFTRTSVRSFDPRQVPEEDVELMLKAAMHAPSAMNQQCWEFFVVDDPGVLSELSSAAPYAEPVGRAPLAIVLAADEGRMKAPLMWQQDLAASVHKFFSRFFRFFSQQEAETYAGKIDPSLLQQPDGLRIYVHTLGFSGTSVIQYHLFIPDAEILPQ